MTKVAKLSLVVLAAAALSACASNQALQTQTVQAKQDAKIKKEIFLAAIKHKPAKKPAPKKTSAKKATKSVKLISGEKAVSWANKQAQRQPNSRAYSNAIMTFKYQPGGLYQVYCAPLQITDIELQPGETITSVAAGDTLRWQVSTAHSGSGANYREHLFVKPMGVGLSNTMVITTTARTYHLDLHSTKQTAMAVVKWDYPSLKTKSTAPVVKTRQQMLDDLNIKSLNFDYQLSVVDGPKPSWMPLTAFSDDGKTYIKFPASMQQAPLLFIGSSAGTDEIVNYRVAGNYYVIDSVVNAAQLRLGQGAGKLSVVQITKVGS